MANIDAFNPETWSDTERIYFKYVDRAIKDREDQRFSNGNPWHAVYLIAAFFKKAKHHIRLFSGELTRQTEDGFKIYADPHVIEAAWLFLLDPKSKLEIVLEKDIDVSEGQSPTDHPLVKGILDMPITTLIRGNFSLLRANETALASLRRKNFPYHFMVMDEQAWRVELNDTGGSIQAIVNAGDKKNAKTLARLFDETVRLNASSLLEGV